MTFEIDTEGRLLWGLTDFLSSFVAILGSTGSGKSNAIAVIAEELLSAGLPLVLVDVAGEHWGLKEKHNIVVVGHSDNTDIECQPSQGAVIAEWSLTQKIPIVLDVSGFDPDERMDLMVSFFDRLWDVAGEKRIPYQVILEEAHNWCPQSGKTPVQNRLSMIALEGRKRGLGIIMASQRAANVSKTIITQTDKRILLLVNYETDLKVYQQLIPRLKPKDVEEIVYTLKSGQALVVHGRPLKMDRVMFRKRHTFDGGYTPGIDRVAPPELKSSGDVLEGLQELLKRSSVMIASDDSAALKRQLAERDERIKTLEGQIVELETRISELSQKMTVKQMVVNEAVLPVAVGGESVPVMTVSVPSDKVISITDEDENYQSTRQKYRSTKQQRTTFDNALDILRKAPKHQRAMVKFLMGYTGEITISGLAQQLDYSFDTINNNQPLILVNMGILCREKHLQKYYYRGKVFEWIKETCPSLEHDKLVDELKAVLL